MGIIMIYRIPTRDSSIDWNIDNAWATVEAIICVEVNTTVPRSVYLLR